MTNEASWDYPQEVTAASDDVTNVDTEKDEDKNDQVDLDVTMFMLPSDEHQMIDHQQHIVTEEEVREEDDGNMMLPSDEHQMIDHQQQIVTEEEDFVVV